MSSEAMEAIWTGPDSNHPVLGALKHNKTVRGAGSLVRELISQGLAREKKASPGKKKED